jgi:glycosyltransferase involved in cell wall biosynthesis
MNHLSYCDKMMAALGSPFGKTPLVGLLMGVKFHHPSMGIDGPTSWTNWCHEKLFTRLLHASGLTTVLIIDPLLVPYMEQRSLSPPNKLRYVPDIAHIGGNINRRAARDALNVEDHQVLILVYGALEERKGINNLLDAVRQLGEGNNIVVLLAGSQDASVCALLSQEHVTEMIEAGMLQVISGFLDDEREFAVFKAADIVWLGYLGFHGMSAVLLQAGLAGLPVIACKEGMIGWLVKQHGLGEAIDATDHAEVASAIRRLATDSRMRRSYGERGRQLAMKHAPQRLAEGVCDAIHRAADAS